jgi:putative hydrolase of the HAD superfamily
MHTKNIIFDFGNVLLDIDIPRTFDSLAHHLGEDYRQKLTKIYPEGNLFDDFEVGTIKETFFLETLRSVADTPLSIRTLREAWNAMLMRIAPQRLEMLLRLRQNYRVFLLSNTNETHLEWVDGYLRQVFDFDIQYFNTTFFEKVYYSYEIGRRKPNADIYEFVMQDAQILPQETLFIDDNADNIATAKQLGWQTILLPIRAEIVERLAHL